MNTFGNISVLCTPQVVETVYGYGLDDKRIVVRFREGETNIFLLTNVFRPNLGTIQSPADWVVWTLSAEANRPKG
jgi:hypothetical protein